MNRSLIRPTYHSERHLDQVGRFTGTGDLARCAVGSVATLKCSGQRKLVFSRILMIHRMAFVNTFSARWNTKPTSRANATTSVSDRLSVTEAHCGRGACREKGRGHLALC